MTNTDVVQYTLKDCISEGLIGTIILAPFIVGLDMIVSSAIGRSVSSAEIVLSCAITLICVTVICGLAYVANEHRLTRTDLEMPPKQ